MIRRGRLHFLERSVLLGGVLSLLMATSAYDASTGKRLWLDRFNGRANGDDVPTGLAVNPNGSAVYVSGWSDSRRVTTSANWTTLALEPSTGATLWERRQFIGVPHALA